MRITFLGAAREVRGSCYLVETQRVSFRVDCGMFQGADADQLVRDPAAIAGAGVLLMDRARAGWHCELPAAGATMEL